MLSLFSSAAANDFSALRADISQRIDHLDELTQSLGRYHHSLIEPLHQLAMVQLEANRFDEASASLQQALQITRFEYGLHTPLQIELMQLSTELEIARGDWEEVDEKLTQYLALINRIKAADPVEQLHNLRWLADTHLQAAFYGPQLQRAQHLIAATTSNEFAVQYAQVRGQAHSPLYAELLYALAQNYYVETRAILGGGSTSYQLRLVSETPHRVDSRSDAIYLRYLVGLEKLYMLRNQIRRHAPEPDEALAMLELHIADWHAAFDETEDMSANYARAIALLAATDVAPAMVERLLANPMPLPRPHLELTVAEALSNRPIREAVPHMTVEGEAGSRQTDTRLPRFNLIEVAQYLPGLTAGAEPYSPVARIHDRWGSIATSVVIDTDRSKSRRYAGFFQDSRVTAKRVGLIEEAAQPDAGVDDVLERVEAITFRPAFRDREPVVTSFLLDFVYRSEQSAGGGLLSQR